MSEIKNNYLYKCKYFSKIEYLESTSIENALELFTCKLSISLDFIDLRKIEIIKIDHDSGN